MKQNFQMYLFWILLKKLSNGKLEGPLGRGGPTPWTMLTVINFKVLALSHLLPPSSLPAYYICAGFRKEKKYVTKVKS